MLILVLASLISASPTKIAFGSCHGHLYQTNYEIFTSIANYSPDIYIWLGDAVYADLESFPNAMSEKFIPGWQAQYKSLKQNPSYQKLKNSTKITGIWDDHDFGENDAAGDFPLKKESQAMFMDFIEEFVDHEGVYRTVFLDSKVRILLLDVRYFRVRGEDVLGAEQWKWLESELKTEYPITLIASGLQVNVEDRFAAYTESWDPKSRARLLGMISDVQGVILLTGDIHFGEILLNTCFKFPILEITSSGLSHTEVTIYGPIANWYIHTTNAMSYHKNLRVFDKHFAVLEIDWEQEMVITSLRGTYGDIIIEEKYDFQYLFKPLNRKNALCDMEPKKRHYEHLSAMIIVFHIPALLLSLSFLIFLRKLSHTY